MCGRLALAQGTFTLKLPRPTASLHRQIARCLWRNAPTLPKEERLKAVSKAELHSGLARAFGRQPGPRHVQEPERERDPRRCLLLVSAYARRKRGEARLNDAPSPPWRAEKFSGATVAWCGA